MKAVILVGGEGIRLRPLTNHRPKAMVPICNKPFLEHLIGYLRQFGVTELILALGYLPQPIECYFGDGRSYGVKLTYVVEETPLGTAGALKNAARYLDDNAFFVLNGDVFTTLDLEAMLACHRRTGAKATIALKRVPDPSRFGVVVTDEEERVRAFVEKPPRETAPSHYINAGIYLLEPELLDRIPAGEFSMLEQGLFPQLAQQGEPFHGFKFRSYWRDIGTPDNYLQLHHDLLSRGAVAPQGEGSQIHPQAVVRGKIALGAGAVVEAGATLVGPAAVGPGCHIETGAVVQGAVLWDGVRVGRGARLRRSIVASRCSIGAGCSLENSILGEDETVSLSPLKR